MNQGYFAHETAVIDEGCSIGSGTKIWHFSHLMPICVIGNDCNIGMNVFIAQGVKLGRNVKVQNNVSLYTGVVCEDDVFIGPSVVFTNVSNPRSAINRKDEFKNTVIRKGATLGANATILCGIEIGLYAFVAAGTVVTKDVLPFQIVQGNPGIPAGWMSEFGHKLDFSSSDIAICPQSKQKYQLKDGRVLRCFVE